MRWIKHNFATVMVICLVMVFGAMAVVAPNFSTGAEAPAAPNVTLTDHKDGTYDISGTDDTMEYNTVSPTHTIWTACSGEADEFVGLKNGANYYFRVKATETTEAGAVKTVSYGISAPTLTSTQNTGATTVRIETLTTDMEYNTEGPMAKNWTRLTTEKIADLQAVDATSIYYFRTVSKPAVEGVSEFVPVSLPCRVAILMPQLAYNKNGTYEIDGITDRFEYNTESASATTWTTFSKITEDETLTYYFRVKATANEAAGAAQGLNVKAKPAAPELSISHNVDGTTVKIKINGAEPTSDYEYTTDPDEEPVTCTDGALATIQKPLDQTYFYYIRLKATDTTYAGYYGYIEIPLQERPEAPELVLDDNDDETVTVTSETVEFTTLEYTTVSATAEDSEWTSCDNDSLIVSDGGIYYFRVEAANGIPAGNVTRAMILIVKDNGNNTVRIDGINDDMEYSDDEQATWKSCSDGKLNSISESGKYYVRISGETEPVSEFNITITVISQPEAPDLNLELNDNETATITSKDEVNVQFNTLEYTTDITDENWTPCSGTELIVHDGGVYYFRVKAVGEIPAGAITRAMVLIPKRNVDFTVYIDGMNSDMYYTKDLNGSWRQYTNNCEVDHITETTTYYVRIGEEVEYITVRVTIIVQPAAPELNIQSNANETVTVTSKNEVSVPFNTLEYTTNVTDENWTACSDTELIVRDGGIYYFRVKAVGEVPEGAVTSVLILIPKANGDNTVRIDEMDSTMWYTKDPNGSWTQYTSGCELDKISETSTYYVKVGEESEGYSTVVVTIESEPGVVKYEITIETPVGGTVQGIGSYAENEDVTLTAVPDSGYRFIDWDVEGVTIADKTLVTITFKMPATAISVKANFAKEYTIRFEGLIETRVLILGELYVKDGALPTPNKQGYTFEGWYLDEEFTNKVDETTTVTTTDNHELYANFTANTYTITLGEGGATQQVTYGEPYGVLPDPSSDGHDGEYFAGWYLDDEYTKPVTSETKVETADNHTLYAKWSATPMYTLTLTANPEAGATQFGGSGNYVAGEEVTIWMAVKSGYTFNRWNVTSGTLNLQDPTAMMQTITMPAEAITLEAQLTANTVTVTVTLDANGGACSTETQDVVFDGSYSVLPTPTKAHCEFVGWYTEPEFENKIGAKVEIPRDHTLYAKWKLKNIEDAAIAWTWDTSYLENQAILNLGFDIVTSAPTTIDWGDGNTQTITTGTDIKHTYDMPGVYLVKIMYDVVTSLDCERCGITELDVSKGKALVELKCSNENLYILDVTQNTALKSLSCTNTEIKILDVSQNTALETLYCGGNNLTSLDVSNNKNLKVLVCSNNDLEVLDMSENTALETLYCDSNSLKYLIISENTLLTKLSCSLNQLTELDVSENTALESLVCYGNNLNQLNVTKNTTLKILSCGNNKLTDLDVSKNTALTSLVCGNNDLKQLDISANTALEKLQCNDNDLTALDVSKNSVLKTLCCGNNKIVTLNVSANTALNLLCCTQETMTKLYLNSTQNGMTKETEDTGCSSIESAVGNLLHKYKDTTIEVVSSVVVFESNGGSSVASIPVTLGGTYGVLEEPERVGYTFEGWYFDEGLTNKVESTTPVTASGVHTLYAKWAEIPTYAVTLATDIVAGGAIGGGGEYEEGQTVTISVTVSNGYTFTGWEVVSGEITLADATALETTFTMVATPVNVKANFVANKYTVTLENETKEVTYGETYGELPTPTKADYVFDGWYLDEGLTVKVESTTLVTTASDHTLYAKWNIANVEDATIAFVWDTTNQLTKSVTLKVNAATKIDWGDGTVEFISTPYTMITLNHTYTTARSYTVKIENNVVIYLDCSGMQLTSLDVSKNTKLEILYCQNNKLSSLNVRKNIVLGELNCSSNQLSSLDLEKNTELTVLDCSNNKLKNLDISLNVALRTLYCGGNQLTTLNIRSNTKLIKVCCVQETLKTVYVTATQKDKFDIKKVDSYCQNITVSYILHRHANTVVQQPSSGSSGGSSSGGNSSVVSGGSVYYPTSSSWKNKFTDVLPEDWYYEAIKFVNKKNYFSGTTTTTFSPNDPMSREMIVTVLYNMEKRPITYGVNPYWDVPSGSWSEAAIVWGTKHGIVSGYPQGHFAPAQPITREELASIMKKYSEYKRANLNQYDYYSIDVFADRANIGDWATEYMVWAVSNDLMNGTYGYLLPQKSATRAEVAAMIMNYCQK